MRKLIVLFFLIMSSAIYGQIIDELPKDENGNLCFNEVIKMDSVDKTTLYGLAKQFYANKFRSANSVIQLDSKEDGVIIGKGYSDTYITVLGVRVNAQMWFTLKVQVKDGRYKYEMYDLYTKYMDNDAAFGLETKMTEWVSVSTYYKSNGNPKSLSEKWKNAMLGVVDATVNNLKSEMKRKSSVKESW